MMENFLSRKVLNMVFGIIVVVVNGFVMIGRAFADLLYLLRKEILKCTDLEHL